MAEFIDIFLHVDKHLAALIAQYGGATLLILFTIIFCETGLVVTPFLPGDSLLFAAGAFASQGSFNVFQLWGALWGAAVLGDNVNYWAGRIVGPRIFHFEDSRFFRKAHLERTHAYYERYGGKTLVIGRFMPIIRTFAPFVAGVGAMTYRRFLAYSVVGGFLWMSTFIFGGFYFGNLPLVQKNFKLVILAVIFVSVMPMMIEFLRHRRGAGRAEPSPSHLGERSAEEAS
ncbi:MAG: DedA family protein [Candidatus Sericytochromatia bacterium]|nr:DedA family protein [Candidatus Sericytochromatia bacterium]